MVHNLSTYDMRILNGRTKGDSLGTVGPHFMETFQNANYFVVKPPTYLSDHSQIVTWIDIEQTLLDSGCLYKYYQS